MSHDYAAGCCLATPSINYMLGKDLGEHPYDEIIYALYVMI